MISSFPVLGYYNPKGSHTELHTDACADGLGAMLLQADSNGTLRLIYAISRRTSEVERNYHSSKLELMTIVWAMERLRVFLIALRFRFITDCQALLDINTLKTKNPQIVRWLNSITDFNFDIQHRPCERMKHVDALSRAPVEDPDDILDTAIAFNTSVPALNV